MVWQRRRARGGVNHEEASEMDVMSALGCIPVTCHLRGVDDAAPPVEAPEGAAAVACLRRGITCQ